MTDYVFVADGETRIGDMLYVYNVDTSGIVGTRLRNVDNGRMFGEQQPKQFWRCNYCGKANELVPLECAGCGGGIPGQGER